MCGRLGARQERCRSTFSPSHRPVVLLFRHGDVCAVGVDLGPRLVKVNAVAVRQVADLARDGGAVPAVQDTSSNLNPSTEHGRSRSGCRQRRHSPPDTRGNGPWGRPCSDEGGHGDTDRTPGSPWRQRFPGRPIARPPISLVGLAATRRNSTVRRRMRGRALLRGAGALLPHSAGAEGARNGRVADLSRSARSADAASRANPVGCFPPETPPAHSWQRWAGARWCAADGREGRRCAARHRLVRRPAEGGWCAGRASRHWGSR